MTSLRQVGILGMGVGLPEKVLTNSDLERMVDTSDEWIRTRVGILERRVVADDQATSDLALMAAQRALEASGTSALDIDLIIVATVVPDMPFPATACLVQHKLGAKNAAAFDLEAACSGFLYGMAVGIQFVACGMYDRVLVIGAETLSRITDFEDRNTCVLMGDGAGAAVLGPAQDSRGILAVKLGADGSGGDILKQPAGGSLKPASLETVQSREHFIQMSGSQVFKFAVRTMDTAVRQVVELAGLTVDDITLLVPHQANLRIIEALGSRLGLAPEKVAINIDRYGNMSAASIPVALWEAHRDGKVKEGDIVVLVAFGGGLTWGSVAIKW